LDEAIPAVSVAVKGESGKISRVRRSMAGVEPWYTDPDRRSLATPKGMEPTDPPGGTVSFVLAIFLLVIYAVIWTLSLIGLRVAWVPSQPLTEY
jgi:hypothetical protein